jgi:hypothetical protein
MLIWEKLIDCPDVPDCECPEPSNAPTYLDEMGWSNCGGSGSSSGSSDASSGESSSEEPMSGSSADACSRCLWTVAGTSPNYYWLEVESCAEHCPCPIYTSGGGRYLHTQFGTIDAYGNQPGNTYFAGCEQ